VVNCCIYEDIYKGQYKNQKYRIWSVMGREGVLAYWYVVMYDSTFDKEYTQPNIDYPEIDIDMQEVDDKITNLAIDIRKLPNYKNITPTEIIHYRKTLVVPLIKEAIKKGDITPI